jgi:hypothetical protein
MNLNIRVGILPLDLTSNARLNLLAHSLRVLADLLGVDPRARGGSACLSDGGSARLSGGSALGALGSLL